MSTLRITHAANGDRTLELDLLALLGGVSSQPSPVVQAAPPAPVTHTQPLPTATRPATRAERKAQRVATTATAQVKPSANGESLTKAERTARNVARNAEVSALVRAGNVGAAASLALSFGWDDMAQRIRAKASAAQASTQMLTAKADKPTKAAAKAADKVAAQVLSAAAKPQVSPSKGRPASQRCATHNLFRKADGTCGKCLAEQPTTAPEPQVSPSATKAPKAPKAPKPAKAERITKVRDLAKVANLGTDLVLDTFPAGLSEGDLAIHWGNLSEQGHKDMLAAALATSRNRMMEPQPQAEKVIHARRVQTLKAILGLK